MSDNTVKLAVKAFCIAAACAFLQRDQPQSMFATVLLMVAVMW